VNLLNIDDFTPILLNQWIRFHFNFLSWLPIYWRCFLHFFGGLRVVRLLAFMSIMIRRFPKATLVVFISWRNFWKISQIRVRSRESIWSSVRYNCRSRTQVHLQQWPASTHSPVDSASIAQSCSIPVIPPGPDSVKSRRRPLKSSWAAFSGGQQQRVAKLPGRLCMNHRIMLFDEPRPQRWIPGMHSRKWLDTMVGLAEERHDYDLRPHEWALPRQVANRVIFMDMGKIVATKTRPRWSSRQSTGMKRTEIVPQFKFWH